MSSIKHAIRPFFAASEKPGQIFYEESIAFDWHSGMSWQVRQRSSDSLANAILARYAASGLGEEDILEVSTASKSHDIGKALSAINLTYIDEISGKSYSVENRFQSAKVFERNGVSLGPYPGLLEIKSPMRYLNSSLSANIAKQYESDELFNSIQEEIRGSSLSRFEMSDKVFPLVPRSCFYDYLYVSALRQEQNRHLTESIMRYRVFTDIMFNPGSGRNKKYNTQARSCAIFVALRKRGLLDVAMDDIVSFTAIVKYQDDPQIDIQFGARV